MNLYLAPGACSLADHIAMHEAGLEFDRVRVDLRAKRTEDGGDFNEVNPEGYVPALVLDDGQLLTGQPRHADRARRLADLHGHGISRRAHAGGQVIGEDHSSLPHRSARATAG
jgi:glutathione S-transferase